MPRPFQLLDSLGYLLKPKRSSFCFDRARKRLAALDTPGHICAAFFVSHEHGPKLLGAFDDASHGTQKVSLEHEVDLGRCHLPVRWDHPVASNMGPPRVHFSRLT